jgi:trk system potassium uptake protein TrkH|tara:strand:- start:803 stop:2254 length:1452 start_codon:yes stop_codon:yes gene_type:complete
MHFKAVLRIVSILMMMFSLTMVPPWLFSVLFDDQAAVVFERAFGYTFISGFVVWFILRKYTTELSIKDGFVVTVLFYLSIGSFGALPFLPVEGLGLSLPNALFESFSGLTTTGATVLTGIDELPASILYYRQQLQWLGGMGIIVLAVAILPMLGVGGMQLYRAEAPGPAKDSKLTPRIQQTALALWWIYLGLTILCGCAYWIAGMPWFDALCHSFSTVAIGGFSTHDASIGYFNSPLIELVAIAFMVISGINFGLHYFAFKERTIAHYVADSEVKFYLTLLFAATVITFTVLFFFTRTYGFFSAARFSLFEVVSIFTTTGFATVHFDEWPSMLPYFIFYGSFVGGCAASTGGGMKVIRVMLLCKQGIREIHRLIHPNAIFPIKLNQATIPNSIVDAVWGFFAIYVIVYIFMLLGLLAVDLDFVTAFFAVGACLNNLGPGLGDVAAHYGNIGAVAKLLLCLTMILGRLEIFTLLVLFAPMFWRK